MQSVERFEHVFLGGGEGGKSPAIELVIAGKRVTVVERGVIGGSCINVAIPTNAPIRSVRVAHSVSDVRAFGVDTSSKVDMRAVRAPVKGGVDGLVEVNRNGFKATGFDLLLGNGLFVAPRMIKLQLNDGGKQ